MDRLLTAAGGKSVSYPMRLRSLFFIAIVCTGALVLVSIRNISDIAYINTEVILSSWKNYKDGRRINEYDYTIKTEGCTIPGLKPFSEEVKAFVEYPKDVQGCPNSSLSLLANNRTHIWVKNENKKHYNVSSDLFFNCCYKSFYRPVTVDDVTSSTIDSRVTYNHCKYFYDIVEVADEFVRVTCNVYHIEIYQQYFLFTPTKKNGSHGVDKLSNNNTYNVIIMGIDAVSRLNFHRTMPQTLSFLREKGAIELLGYNKVGDNTFPNLLPMLMGISEKELKYTCVPNEKSTFDNCPFVWEWFKKNGYYTAFGEDSSSLGTFNYEKAGFIRTPTDYYIHTFINEAEKAVGTNKDGNSYLCMNEKYFYTVLLDYIENLSWTLKSNRLFGFFWEVTISHDYVNYPMLIDQDYVNFFEKLYANDYLDNTILFLVSDHGMRWGDIRSTNQGRLEERLPFVFILTPPEFRNKYSYAFKNLNMNSHRLTTPYDIHATLQDLIDLKGIENTMIDLRKDETNAESKGISLFTPIPTNRTCESAYIDDHWCSCHKSHKLSIQSEKSLKIAVKLLEFLNDMIKDHPQCSFLTLTELIEITELEISSPENDKIEWREYMLVIRTTPGNGLFEGTLRYDGHIWSLISSISRLNLYGDQSRCIHNYFLKLYCFCK